MCPGKKEYVSVKIDGQRTQIQKRLLLINLKELYTELKAKEPICKIGFSKFCELRPAWCVTVGARGAHSVCVCEIHQNVKLLIDATPGVKNYQELMTAIVCDHQNRDCMLHRCDMCPGTSSFSDSVMVKFTQADMAEEDPVSFKQWEHSERGCTLVSRSDTVTAFVEELTRQMDNLTTHHYIAKSQAAFLSYCKASLTADTALVL